MEDTRVTSFWVEDVKEIAAGCNALIGQCLTDNDHLAVNTIIHFQIVPCKAPWWDDQTAHINPGYDVVVLCEMTTLRRP